MTKAEKAKDFFNQGYNCSQSVTLAFAEELNLPQEVILKLELCLDYKDGKACVLNPVNQREDLSIKWQSKETYFEEFRNSERNEDLLHKKFYVKNTSTVERMEKITDVVFDKTGTITESDEAQVQ